MKKLIISVIILFLLLVAGVVSLRFIDFNTIGATKYYTKIVKDGAVEKESITTGEVFSMYWYNDYPVYSDAGKEKLVNFSASKNLRQGAYLLIYYKDNKGVTMFEEVNEKDIPKTAKEIVTQM